MSASAPKRQPAQEGSVRPMQGAVHSTTIPELFHELGTGGATGVLMVAGRSVKKAVYFQAGRVQFATSTDRDDRFNQVLLKAGAISLRELLRALEVSLATRDRLGEVMVRSKMLTPADVDQWVKVQVREIIYSLFNRTAGHWSFEATPFPAESIALGVTGDAMVVEGIRRVSSWARISEAVGGLNTEYLATGRAAQIIAGLPLLPGEHKLIEMGRTPTSLGEMCDASELGDLDVCRAVWSLLTVGALMKS